MTVTSTARVVTDRGERYRKQLASHFGNRIEVTESPSGTVLTWGFGGTTTLAHVTVSSNAASTGAGVFTGAGGTTTLTTTSTVTGNTAALAGGGLFTAVGGTSTLDDVTVFTEKVEGVRLVLNKMKTDAEVLTGRQMAAKALNGYGRVLQQNWLLAILALVIAAGTDAVSCGLLAGSEVTTGGVGATVPVDIWLAGSPPSPFGILNALLIAVGRLADGQPPGASGGPSLLASRGTK